MQKTRLLYLSLLAIALVAFSAFSTLALFTDTSTQTGNTFVAGTVAIESVTLEGQVFVANVNVARMAPGDKGSGTVTVKNAGSLDAWVKITSFTTAGELFAGSTPLQLAEANGTKLIPSGQSRDFLVYYQMPLNAGNSYQAATGTVAVNFGAEQVKHNAAGGFFAFPENGGTLTFANGRAEFTALTSGAKARAGLNGYGGVKLAEITRLEYTTFVDTNTNGQAPSLQFRVDRTGDGTADDTLVFEPIYQKGYGNPYPEQGPVVTGSSQTWNALIGGWWDYPNRAFGQEGHGAKTLAQYVALYPNAAIVMGSPGYEGVGLKAGSGWTNFRGSVDELVIGVGGTDTTYTFE